MPGFAEEVAKWTDDVAEAVIEAIADKQFVITMDPVIASCRYTVRVGAKNIEIAMQQDKICYEYPYSQSETVTAAVEKAL